MKPHRINHIGNSMNMSSILPAALVATLFLGTPLLAVDLPQELPLWEKGSLASQPRLRSKTRPRSSMAW
ncbi:MAG: hypothetical protein ACYTG0_08560 [Planctomycetota bacterium]|jgi:hypothetical protein